MYRLIIALLAVTYVSACTPGASLTTPCKSCICDIDEKFVCTKIACDSNEVGRAINRVPVKRSLETCTPGKPFAYYCNMCFCGDDGLRINAPCTRKGCGDGIWKEDGTRIFPI